jgi:hypothetical protein
MLKYLSVSTYLMFVSPVGECDPLVLLDCACGSDKYYGYTPWRLGQTCTNIRVAVVILVSSQIDYRSSNMSTRTMKRVN